jgi:hypothetical protein
MSGILYRDPLRGVLAEPEPQQLQGLLGPATVNPLMARQVATQRAAYPRTILNTPQQALDFGAGVLGMVPGAGDAFGLAADLNRYRNEPESRTMGNFALTAAGLLPLVPAMSTMKGMKWLSKDEMIKRGADGHLSRAYEAEIPVSKISGREPTPAMEGGYKKGRKITQPIEVLYQPDTGEYILFAGNHRVTQAEINGDETIKAFVEVEGATPKPPWAR